MLTGPKKSLTGPVSEEGATNRGGIIDICFPTFLLKGVLKGVRMIDIWSCDFKAEEEGQY